MKKNKNILIIILVGIALVGLLSLSIIGYIDNSYFMEEDIAKITELISQNIYLEIQNELTKPISTTSAMANDRFLKARVFVNRANELFTNEIIDYLYEFKQEHNYYSAFFISNYNNKFYSSDGTVLTLNSSNMKDAWFYNFLDNDSEYELFIPKIINTQDGVPVVTVYHAITSDDKKIGVAGVNIRLKEIEKILKSYQEDLDGDIFLMSSDGTIQIHSNAKYFNQINAFEDRIFFNEKDKILSEKNEIRIFSPQDYLDDPFFSSYYIEDLDLFLIVNQNYFLIDDLLYSQKNRVIIVFVLGFVLVAAFVIWIAGRYHRKTIKLVKTDYLTDIYNRNAFDESLKNAILQSKVSSNPLTLAIIDVDNFKTINDVHGHVEGDKILINTANHLKTYIRSKDIVARWGGDEFAIIFSCEIEETDKILNRIKKSIPKNKILSKHNITFSIGITEYKKNDTENSILTRADEALYCAKDNGKNKICRV